MNKALLSALFVFTFSGANAAIIDFESGLDPLFSYDRIAYSPEVRESGSGYDSMTIYTGSVNQVFNPYEETPSTFTWAGAGTFTLNSFAIAGAWGSQTLKIEGLFDNAVINTANFAINNLNVDIFSPNWTGIDAFRIWTGGDYAAYPGLDGLGQHWVLDNININAEISEVPLPAAAFLFAPALLGFMGLRRMAKVAIA